MPNCCPGGLYGPGMRDYETRLLEVGRRVANAEDDEADGMGPLLDAHLVEYERAGAPAGEDTP